MPTTARGLRLGAALLAASTLFASGATAAPAAATDPRAELAGALPATVDALLDALAARAEHGLTHPDDAQRNPQKFPRPSPDRDYFGNLFPETRG